MKLWFRMIGYFLSIWLKPKLATPLETSHLSFRVWPTDLDMSLHMNNGRYLTLMDFGRLDILVRTPLWKMVVRNGWTPVVSSSLVRFRRELKLFEPFVLESFITSWSEKTVIFEQRLRFTSGARKGAIAASAFVRAGIYNRKTRSFIPVAELMAEMDFYPAQPEPSAEVQAFLNAEDALRLADLHKGH